MSFFGSGQGTHQSKSTSPWTESSGQSATFATATGGGVPHAVVHDQNREKSLGWDRSARGAPATASSAL